ncbi:MULTISPECIES: universal stress protein [Rhodococcus]|uniref:Universal stress protein n=1 Tax=Rhodococcus aetherivorans TaxID=191292 RepID=A0A059MPL9_9NOCA|nr:MULTISPECIES: universal stress protein [Rhodococcus]ETT27394.1 UspA domain-containing protein [Rhodococcus rhodochrous ATCC 21198]NCL78280.1 Universal stress protein [Rhodococcus sp. YH1]AKE92579.1 universal stress protein [Rhodococcus aetherivorans]ANZ28110.1 universal stress protein [Rhodococcus sp. WB1]KDE13154.1 universal stress protein [Rhodococcus aetherivorans]
MSAYRTVVVGTDGSESSYRAVEKAAALAGDAEARLVIACAYYPVDPKDSARAADVLGEDAYQVTGSAPTYDILRTAREKAHAAGAKNVLERAVVGAPVDSLLELVDEVEADLLVVGNRGLNTLTGRLLGSVPSDLARKSTSDVLIVHTVR